MSGHNKWSTIKRKKGAIDAKRSKIFSKINKEITVAVKESGPDPDSNPRLRLAIANAKGASMPKDNIQRAISKGSDKDGASFIECTFEGYANGGVAICCMLWRKDALDALCRAASMRGAWHRHRSVGGGHTSCAGDLSQ